MKKKQASDFQKRKHKIGKPLPKGLNVTKTSFKSKKICFDRKYVPDTPSEINLKDVLKALNNRDVNIKYDNFRKLIKYVSNNEDTLFMYFPDILKELGRTLQDNDRKVREQSIELIGQCVNCLTEAQFRSFTTHISLFLKCMMTRNVPMQLDSLKLLDKLLNSHPKVMYHNVHILTNLLNLISVKPEGLWKKSKERVLIEIINNKITTEGLRLEVLARILLFLQVFTANENTNDVMDDKEVQWDGKEPLFLPLYRNSGTVPAKLDYSWINKSDSKEFEQFIFELVPVLSAVLNGVAALSSNTSEKKFYMSQSVCKFLIIVTEILYYVGEWYSEIFSKDKNRDLVKDSDLTNNLKVICQQFVKYFPYYLETCDKKNAKIREVEYMQLNLAICYLHTKFVIGTSKEIFSCTNSKVLLYIISAFRTSRIMCEKSVIFFLKTNMYCIQRDNIVISVKEGIIAGLNNLLEAHEYHPLSDMLFSFFMDFSMNYDFKNLMDSGSMFLWFNSILKELDLMVNLKKIKKKFLKYLQQVCARRYPIFMKALNLVRTDIFISHLQFDDETFQLTIIHLITSQDVISPESLEDIARTITHTDFSLKTTLRMIHFLHSRYVQPDVSAMDKLLFLKFLLNVGCDSFFNVKPFPKPEELLPLCNSIMEAEESCLCTFELYAHPVSKKHLEIFEVCFNYLILYIRSNVAADCVMCFMKSFCFQDTKLPAHSAIAIMELRNRISFLYHDEELNTIVNEICFSSTVYMSYAANAAPEESWDDYLLPQFQKSFNHLDVRAMMQIIEQKLNGYGKNEMYLVFKVINYLFKRTRDENMIYEFLEKIGVNCHEDHTLSKMWMDLCKIWMR